MTRREIAGGEAHARAALAGNPSDGYGGAVLALTLGGLRAEAFAWPAPALEVSPDSEIVRATVTRFAREHEPAAARTAIEVSTSIPRGVGLGGSSAIVIATLRALCSLYRCSLGDPELATMALAVETDELGVPAGLQDRVTQAHGGLMFMDFSPSAGAHAYERLDAALLPPLLIAWRADAGGDSGAVHAPLRERHARGEPVVVDALRELGTLARRARAALAKRDHVELRRCVDRSFDARRRMLELDPRHVEMIECARACGASANYTGSGGAIVAVCADAAIRARTRHALRSLGCEVY
jgi:galactokinase/mevalonate kinase-like predicted kinase